MQWNTSYQESVFSFANNINTHEGGSHMSGFRSALTSTLNKYARDKGLLKEKEDNLEGEDVREGLAAVISVKLAEPQFEGQTKTKLGNPWVAGLVSTAVNQKLARVLRGEPGRRAPDHQQGDRRVARPPGRAQGARADAPQVGAREHVAAGQARRLLDQGSRVRRALHRRGRQRRRLGEDGPRPHLPGDPAAARQDHQQREEPHQQGALEQRDPGDDHRDRHRHQRRVRRREAPLPPRDRDDRRRRRRLAHPHADPHVPVPADARADRPRPRLHRGAAALPGEARQPGVLLREGRAARGAARARAHPERRRHARATATQVKFTEARWNRFAKELQQYEGYYARLRSDFGAAGDRADDPAPSRRARDRGPRRPAARDQRDRRQRLRAVGARARRRRVPGRGSSRPRRPPAATSPSRSSCSPRRSTAGCAPPTSGSSTSSAPRRSPSRSARRPRSPRRSTSCASASSTLPSRASRSPASRASAR